MPDKEEKINKEAPFYTRHLPPNSPRIFKQYDPSKIESYYPFNIYKDDSYMVFLEIGRDPKVLDTYDPIFEDLDYNGSGNDWAALVSIVLKKEDPALISKVQFDPEGGGFYLFADSEKTQRQVAKYISNAFGDVKRFEAFLKAADKQQVENFDPSNP